MTKVIACLVGLCAAISCAFGQYGISFGLALQQFGFYYNAASSGVKADGVTDCTVQMQNAINAASQGVIGGLTRYNRLVLPPGRIRITNGLSIPSGLIVESQGTQGTEIYADYTGTDYNALTFTGQYDRISNITITASPARQARSSGGPLVYPALSTNNGIYVSTGGYAAKTAYTDITHSNLIFDNVIIQYQPGHGALSEKPELNYWANSISQYNGLDGWSYTALNNNSWPCGQGDTFLNCRAYGNGYRGWDIDQISGIVFENCESLQNNQAFIKTLSASVGYQQSAAWNVLNVSGTPMTATVASYNATTGYLPVSGTLAANAYQGQNVYVFSAGGFFYGGAYVTSNDTGGLTLYPPPALTTTGGPYYVGVGTMPCTYTVAQLPAPLTYNSTTGVVTFYPVWSSVTTYAANTIVQGSDGNTYYSVASGNLNNNPTSTSGLWTITNPVPSALLATKNFFITSGTGGSGALTAANFGVITACGPNTATLGLGPSGTGGAPASLDSTSVIAWGGVNTQECEEISCRSAQVTFVNPDIEVYVGGSLNTGPNYPCIKLLSLTGNNFSVLNGRFNGGAEQIFLSTATYVSISNTYHGCSVSATDKSYQPIYVGPTSTGVVTYPYFNGGSAQFVNPNVALTTAAFSIFGGYEVGDGRSRITGLWYVPSTPTITAGAITPNASTQTFETLTLTANLTVNAPSNPAQGTQMTYSFIQDSTGGRTITWNSVFHGVSGLATGTAGQMIMIDFRYNGTYWVAIGTPAWTS